MLLYNPFKKCIRTSCIKLLIGPHHRHQIFCLRKIDNIMGIARQHMYRLNLIPGNFKASHRIRLPVFIKPNPSFLNQSMPRHDNKKYSPAAYVPPQSYPRKLQSFSPDKAARFHQAQSFFPESVHAPTRQ